MAAADPNRNAGNTASKERGRGLLTRALPQRVDQRRVVAHSRWVQSLRILLPLTALCLTVAVLLWPTVGPNKSQVRLNAGQLAGAPAAKPQDDVLRMTQPRFVSTDQDNRPFTVTADEARQARADDSEVTLMAPKADMSDKAGAWMQIGADTGYFNRKSESLRLEGNVTLFHDTGMEMQTERVGADLKERIITSDSPVEGQGPQGSLSAQNGFRILNSGQRIELLGPSKVVLRGGAS
ncbi:LPS export ABC transporter periplasmic protein LptC [Lacibacterium aquatile]|uniref:LPS export ABC transporter periplasmic protein LptC n=1 Tax=Lacibacterium aquatile TaxID=1168082 RepID=A0ABW5DMP7_9PROT